MIGQANRNGPGGGLRSEVNELAPVRSSSEIEIAATPDVAWDVLTAFEAWPSWNPEIKSVTLEGGVEAGSQFRWKSGPGTITSVIQDVEAPRRIAWTGKSFGITAIHLYKLEQLGTRTLVMTEETYEGTVARLFNGVLRKKLERVLQSGLRHLKAEAERRAQTATKEMS